MRPYFLLIVSCIVFNPSFSQMPSYNKKDMATLNTLPVKWQRFWNAHNMDSAGALLTNDVDFITVAGTWLQGRGELVKDHKAKHLTIFKTSVWTTDSVDIKFIKPDLAIMHVGWGITGDSDPDGTPRQPRHGIFTWVVIKQKTEWLIVAVHNVNKREAVVVPQ